MTKQDDLGPLIDFISRADEEPKVLSMFSVVLGGNKSLLHHSVENSCWSATQLLLMNTEKLRLNVAYRDAEGRTALMLALQKQDIRSVKILLKAAQNGPSYLLGDTSLKQVLFLAGIADSAGITPLMRAISWIESDNSGDVFGIIQNLLDAKADILAVDSRGNLADHYTKKKEVLSLLQQARLKRRIENPSLLQIYDRQISAALSQSSAPKPDDTKHIPQSVDTGHALFNAVAKKDGLELLLDFMGRLDEPGILQKFQKVLPGNKNLLHYSVENACLETTQLLLMNAQKIGLHITARDDGGNTALMLALKKQKIAIVQPLLKEAKKLQPYFLNNGIKQQKIFLASIEDGSGMTPLMCAIAWAEKDKSEAVHAIIQGLLDAEADVLAIDNSGNVADNYTNDKTILDKLCQARLVNVKRLEDPLAYEARLQWTKDFSADLLLIPTPIAPRSYLNEASSGVRQQQLLAHSGYQSGIELFAVSSPPSEGGATMPALPSLKVTSDSSALTTVSHSLSGVGHFSQSSRLRRKQGQDAQAFRPVTNTNPDLPGASKPAGLPSVPH